MKKIKPKTPKKAPIRWNARKKISGQSLLIYSLLQKFGGVDYVSKQLSIPHYRPTNWHQDGQVPLKYLDMVSEALGCSRIGLNYKAARSLLGKDVPSWEKVVKSYGFGKEVEQRIIKLGPPK